MEIGRFFLRSLMSLWRAVKYWDPKCWVVVGDSLLFVVISMILINVSRYICVVHFVVCFS